MVALTRENLSQSRFFLLFMSALVALGPLSIDTYMPAIPAMSRYFGVPISAVNLTMSAYLIGSGIGQFLGGALSDHLGRKVVALAGLGVFVVCSALIAHADSIQAVQGLRFAQALGGGFTTVNCLAQVRDVYPAEEVVRRYTGVMLIVLMAPMVAPLLGAVLMSLGWQAIFHMLTLYGALCLVLFTAFVPETRTGARIRPTVNSMLRNYVDVVSHRIDGRIVAIRYALFGCLSAGLFMCYLTTAAALYMRHYQRNEYEFSLMFGAGGLALMAGNRLAVLLMGTFSTRQILHFANLAQIVVTSLLLLAATLGLDSVWLVFGSMLAVLVLGAVIGPNAAGTFISFFDRLSGSASSLNTTLRTLLGAAIGALAAALSADSIAPIFAVMLGSAMAARFVLSTIR